jgi:cellulose synthase/poly-beta-1,6-N-acetylglucosamine synthase-like glycosyltransferase
MIKVNKIYEMTLGETVIYFLLLSFGLLLTFIWGVWWFQTDHIADNFFGRWHIIDYCLFAILSYIVWHHIIMEVFTWVVAAHMSRPQYIPPRKGLKVAYLTAFVPGSEPYNILEKTLKAMVEVEYPHDTWLLDEGDDDVAKEICRKLGVKHYSRRGKDEFNTTSGRFTKKTKGGNYNSWLHHYLEDYDVIAQHDMDFIPKPYYLTRTLGYFSDPEVAFVGCPQIYGNEHESWIARGASEQTYSFYGPLQKGFFGHDMTLLIGANHIFRTEAYRDIGGYSAHIAEDMLTGMKLYAHKKRWQSVYVPETLLIGEGPTTWGAYFAQQMRWAYGCMDIAFRHSPSLLVKMKFKHILNYFFLMQYYFAGVAQTIGIVLLVLYFTFGITPAAMALLPVLIIYLPLVIYQILFNIWLQRFNIIPEKEFGLLLRGRLLLLAVWPIFFLAFIGVVKGKRLTYAVTPKGNSQISVYQPKLFIIHLILGLLTFISMIIGYFNDHFAGPMVFWAVLNTIFMLYFVIAETAPVTYHRTIGAYLT